MTTIVLVLLGYVVVLVIGDHIEHAVTRRWDKDREHADRLSQREYAHRSTANALNARDCAVRERQMTLEERKYERFSSIATADPMPADIVDRIMAWEDDWAREDQKKIALALYAEHGNWETVRRFMHSGQ